MLVSLITTSVLLLLTPLLWPIGALSDRLLRKLGYTTWLNYVLAGAIAGLLLGILFPFVDTAPETNGYVELFGWSRAKLYVAYYIQATTAGILFALCYWYARNPKPPEPVL